MHAALNDGACSVDASCNAWEGYVRQLQVRTVAKTTFSQGASRQHCGEQLFMFVDVCTEFNCFDFITGSHSKNTVTVRHVFFEEHGFKRAKRKKQGVRFLTVVIYMDEHVTGAYCVAVGCLAGYQLFGAIDRYNQARC